MSFVHLHSHSEYSMLDGASRIDEMFSRAKELGMPALALTDHGVMYGAIPFYLAGKAAGVKPLIGMEAYVAPRSRFDRAAPREDAYYHLTVLAASNAGYKNLMALSSLGFLEGYDGRSRRPRVDKEVLAAHSEGLIVLSGCLSGEVARCLTGGRDAEARRVAEEYKEIFGDRYYLEIQYQGLGQQPPLNAQLAGLGEGLGIPLVATNDSHYTAKGDAGAHDILLCIQTGKALADTGRLRFDTEEFYLKSREEMAAALPDYPESIENTLAVAERCSIDIELHRMLLPQFEVPEGETLDSFLRGEAYRGAQRRFGSVADEVTARLDYELSVIERMGFAGYFLIVADFVGWAKRNRIRVGPGRGSVGGSMVAYTLGITDLDPLRWKLGFERFLNPGRKQMPDMDIDFDERRRGEVIRYVCEKYGEDRVAQIVTFSTIKAKAAIRDGARVLGLPYAVGDRLAKIFPPSVLGKEAPFEACFDKSFEWPENSGRNDAFAPAAELRRAYNEDEVAREVIETARKLEGLRRQHSVHAAGVVIGREPLVNHVPLQRTDAEVVTQYEMNAVEQIGLLKMDFLGLRNLTVIEDTLRHIRANRGSEVDIDSVAVDDEKVFALLQKGASSGIFQMESPGMTRLLRSLRPDRFEEIAALIALYRPGPMDEIGRYVKGKHEPATITYPHELLRQVLADTNGVIVYQEQVTEILQVMAGFSPEEADLVRYAVAKKKSDVLVGAKTRFSEGCQAAGLSSAEADSLWDLIRPFAGYSFNRAHANGYGLIAYQTAWLKAHYPVEYLAAVLTSVKNTVDKMPVYLAECRAQGIKVLPPDVNQSGLDFTPRGDEILFGLSAIRNVGEQVAERIIHARASKGPYRDFGDFLRRVDSSVMNKKVLESLARAGALDALGCDRAALLGRDPKGSGLCLSEQTAKLIEAVMGERKSEEAGQFSLFGGAGAAQAPAGLRLRQDLVASDLSRSELLAAEKEVLGFFVSDHPLSGVEAALRYRCDAEITELSEAADGSTVTVGGILTGLQHRATKKGEPMALGTLEDMKGSVELIFFPQCLKETPAELLGIDRILVVKGRIDLRDDAAKIMVSSVSVPDLSGAASPLRIKMPASHCTPDRLDDLKAILAAHPGPSPVLLHLGGSQRTTVLRLGGDFTVELRGGLFAELKTVLGADAVLDSAGRA